LTDPGQVEGLVRHTERVVAVGAQQEANIVMKMSGYLAMGGDPVDIQVKDLLVDRSDALEAGLLSGLAKCDAQYVRIAVGVTAKLKPESELAVMGQQNMGAGRIDHPPRAGDVSFLQRSLKAVGMRLHKREDLLASFLLFLAARFMRSEFLE
jgi:hypothetical protein